MSAKLQRAIRTEWRPNPVAVPILDRTGELSNQVGIRLITVLVFSTALATISSGRVKLERLKNRYRRSGANQPFHEST